MKRHIILAIHASHALTNRRKKIENSNKIATKMPTHYQPGIRV